MIDTPERIWATEDAKNFGEDRFHTTMPMAGLVEYIRADVHAAEIARLRAANEQLGKDLNRAKYGQPDFAWSLHLDVVADLRAKVDAADRLAEAASPYISPLQNADYGRQLRQHDALTAAITAYREAGE